MNYRWSISFFFSSLSLTIHLGSHCLRVYARYPNLLTSLSIHQPLYPPGRIIHIVRHHPKGRGGGREPAYQGVWADNKDFDEVIISQAFISTIDQSQVLISKRMLQDHMPDNVLDALEKVRIFLFWRLDLFMCLTVERVVCKFIKLFLKFQTFSSRSWKQFLWNFKTCSQRNFPLKL